MRLFRPAWSGDGKRIAYGDKEGRLWVIPADGGSPTQVADERNYRVTDYVWSPDGQWLAYSLSTPTTNRALWIWGVADGKARQVTDGFWGEHDPSWDPEGKYLWYMSEREFQPQFSQSEWNFATNRMTSIYALALRKDVADPFAPLSDEVKLDDDKDKKDDAKKDDSKKDDAKKDEKKDEAKKPKEPIKIDFEGLGSRVSRCPLDADNYDGLTALKGTLVYVRSGAAYYGRDSEAKSAIKAYDLEKRKESTMVENAGSFAISWDGKKILVQSEGAYTLYDVPGASKDSKKTVSTSGLMVDRIPREEWRTAFNEVWRRYRDFFYAENMHGYDWEALRKQYAPLVEQVGHRSDLNYVLGEMVAELSVGHAYIDGGDWQKPTRAPVGLLGGRIDWDGSHYRIGKIWKGQNEEPRYRSPLTEIGVDVKEGDVLLAIDGEELTPDRDPYALLVNKTNPITLTLAGRDGAKAERTVKVNPIRDEGSLIYLDWTERNRAYVDKATGGKVAYMHIPNMGGRRRAGVREVVLPSGDQGGDDRGRPRERRRQHLVVGHRAAAAEGARHRVRADVRGRDDLPRPAHPRSHGLPDQRDLGLRRRHLPLHVP
jgi:tricorn protease